MGSLSNRVKKAVRRSAGTSFWRKFTVLSSDITTSQQALSSAATGDLMVTHVIFQTDATGLAGSTNFLIGVSGETYGLNTPIEEAVSNLGASQIRVAPHSGGNADTTNDTHITVTAAVPFLLEAGDSLQYSGSSSAGTGAGICAVLIRFERLVENADIQAVV